MDRNKRTILIVDDSKVVRETVRFVLQSRGYEVFTLDSPFGFGAALSEAKPDLVLVDANMPALSGEKLVTVALQNKLCSCPVVFYSDKPSEELKRLVQTTGAAGFIRKTGDHEAFLNSLEEFLAGSGEKPPSLRSPSNAEPPTSQRANSASPGPNSARWRSSGPKG